MNEITNPFRPTRWEHHRDGKPLLWFTNAARELAAPKSVFIYGSRGSGKTSLLKSICWEDLAGNDSLRLQRHIEDFDHIGIYIRFPDHISQSLDYDGWRAQFPQAANPAIAYHRFFSLAVELVCAERTLEALHALRVKEMVTFAPGQELQIVEDFCQEYESLGAFASRLPRTFLELARLLRNIVPRMSDACTNGTAVALADRLPPREPNQLLAYLAERLIAAVRIKGEGEPRQTSLKFCLDDCEVLSDVQRRSLNTLVRLSKSPISWVISSVGEASEASETFLDAQPLTDADRLVRSLNDRKPTDFLELCQSVISLRLYFSLPAELRPDPSPESRELFDLSARLGDTSVNHIVQQMLRRSKSPSARLVQDGAQELHRAIGRAGRSSPRRYNADAIPPYYEAYLLMHWQGSEEAFKTQITPADVKRLPPVAGRVLEDAFNAWIRGKQLGSLLHLAQSLRMRKMPLFGSNIIISLADSSIRDFLEMMAEIFERYASSTHATSGGKSALERFALTRTQLAQSHQNDAIYAASQDYYNGVANHAESDADMMSRLVNGLGNLTSLLQSNPADPRVFATPERGVFVIEFETGNPNAEEEAQFVSSIIQQGLLAGYLRSGKIPKAMPSQAEVNARLIAFRLHRRFAPFFTFSYRGAYAPVRIAQSDVASLCRRIDEQSPFSWAKAIAGIVGKVHDRQIKLPLKGGEHHG